MNAKDTSPNPALIPQEISILDASGTWNEKVSAWLPEWETEATIWPFRTVFKLLSYLDKRLLLTEAKRLIICNPIDGIIRNPEAVFTIISQHQVAKHSPIVLIGTELEETDLREYTQKFQRADMYFWDGRKDSLKKILTETYFLAN